MYCDTGFVNTGECSSAADVSDMDKTWLPLFDKMTLDVTPIRFPMVVT